MSPIAPKFPRHQPDSFDFHSCRRVPKSARDHQMSRSVPNPDTTCRSDGFVITAVKLRGCQQLPDKGSARWCLDVFDASNIGQFGLDVQPRPHRVDGFGRRVDEINAPFRVTPLRVTPISVSTFGRVTFGFGMPDRLHLEQRSVTAADVVFSKFQRCAPSRPFEVTSVCLLKYGTVLALAADALGRSLDHVPIMNKHPCGSSVQTRCEFEPISWGQTPDSCGLVVGRAHPLV